MNLLSLLFPLIVCGGLAYLISVLPIANPFKTACYVVLALVLVVVLFQVLGIPTRFPS